MLAPWKKSYDQPRQHIKKQRHYFANKVPSIQGYDFSSSHIWMWELDYKESWAPKIWCFWTVVLEKTLKSPLDCKEIQPVYPKGNQSWIFIGRIDVKAEIPILWPPDVKNWLLWQDLDAGSDWRLEEKGTIEDEMVGWHHQLYGHEFEQALGVGDGQGGLACCSPWGCQQSDMTERLNLTKPKMMLQQTLESPLNCTEIKLVNPKGNQPWILTGRIDTEGEAPWKRPRCWERLKAKGEESGRGWDGWIASLIQWIWTWANSRRWWRTGRLGVLQSMESQTVRHNLVTEQQQPNIRAFQMTQW